MAGQGGLFCTSCELQPSVKSCTNLDTDREGRVRHNRRAPVWRVIYPDWHWDISVSSSQSPELTPVRRTLSDAINAAQGHPSHMRVRCYPACRISFPSRGCSQHDDCDSPQLRKSHPPRMTVFSDHLCQPSTVRMLGPRSTTVCTSWDDSVISTTNDDSKRLPPPTEKIACVAASIRPLQFVHDGCSGLCFWRGVAFFLVMDKLLRPPLLNPPSRSLVSLATISTWSYRGIVVSWYCIVA